MAGGKYCVARFKVCFLGVCGDLGGEGGEAEIVLFLYLLLKAVEVCSVTCPLRACGGEGGRILG